MVSKLGVGLIYGCGLYISWREKHNFLLKDMRFLIVKPDPNMITLSFYEKILKVLSNIQTFSVVVNSVMLC